MPQIRLLNVCIFAVCGLPCLLVAQGGGAAPYEAAVQNAKTLISNNRLADGAAESLRAINLNRNGWEAYALAGIAYAKMDDCPKAVPYFRNALNLAPDQNRNSILSSLKACGGGTTIESPKPEPLPVRTDAPGPETVPQLMVEREPLVRVRRGTTANVTLRMLLGSGLHANSATPTEPNLIPLVLKWTGGPLTSDSITYPKAEMKRFSFTGGKPISVVAGALNFVTGFQVPANAAPGPAMETGTVRYQACNDRMCFPPKTMNVNLSIYVE